MADERYGLALRKAITQIGLAQIVLRDQTCVIRADQRKEARKQKA